MVARVGSGVRVVGYVCLLAGEQPAGGLRAQRATIRAECERRGWRLLRFEQDEPGSESRAGLGAALAACRAGRVEALVVAKLDRLGGRIVEVAGLLEDARNGGFNLVALDLGLELQSGPGELVANVLTTLVQAQRQTSAKRRQETLARKQAAGVPVGRPRRIPNGILERIRREHDAEQSLATIANGLNSDRVPTGQGGRRWYPATIRYLLNREREPGNVDRRERPARHRRGRIGSDGG